MSHRGAPRHATQLITYLFIFLGVLLAYLAFVIYRLRKTSQDFKTINENLEQRVEDRTMELMWSNIELQKSEANNKALLNAMPDAIWRTDGKGIFLDVIPAQSGNIIVDTEGWKGKAIFDVLPPHISDRMTDLADRSIKTGEPQTLDFVLSRNDKIQHYECRIVVCGESEILTVVRDVTELKQAVAESQVILETIQGVSTTTNVKELLDHIYHSISRFLYSENCFVALYDAKTSTLDMEFFVDKYELVPPPGKLGNGLTGYAFRIGEPMLLTDSAIESLIEDGEIEMIGRRPAVWLGVPLRTPKGVIGVLAVQHYDDSTVYGQRDLELLASIGDQIAVAIDRKRAENEMFDAKSFLNRVIDNVPNLIYVKDKLGRYVLTNYAFAALHGKDVKDVIGKTDQELIGPNEDAARYDLSDHFVISNKQEYINQEEKVLDAQGNIHWLQSVKRPLMGTAGVEYILGIATDLTERKNLEAQLRQAQKLESIGQLAAGIAHEINTPAQYVGDNVRFLRDSFNDYSSVLKLATEILSADRPGGLSTDEVDKFTNAVETADIGYLNDEVPKAFDQALDGVERISKIVQSMKDFAHPGSNDFHATDLNKAIESTITVASNEWKYVANIVTDYDRDLPLVPCLTSEFNQVILNMIVNASHAIADVMKTDPGGKGTIAIKTKNKGDHVEVQISDTGCGMPEEIRKKIFDPFFTTKEVGKGTGQGLAISHTVIVEKHKGTIDVTSLPGHGTTFVISLPLSINDSAAVRIQSDMAVDSLTTYTSRV
ncbi:MAG TPA: ATP-binding protein [Pyrinomonadaceae bacterium]|nr:ATP-binding protein [Pyrinomonadaceae bacterium]